MLAGREARLPASRHPRSRAALGWLVIVAVLVAAVAFVSLAAAPWQGSHGRAQTFPAELVMDIDPETAGYRQPADAVELDGVIFALDTGSNRILVQDGAGLVKRVIDGSTDGQPVLRAPMSIASDGRHLYVANSGASEVLVLDLTGRLIDTFHIAPQIAGGPAPRPVGVAVAPDGTLWVSDPDSNRLLQYGAHGEFLRDLGGTRAGGSEGYNAPTGISIDAAGNIYVVDTLNGRVLKLSPDGAQLQQFGRPGDTAGTFSRPKDVAVDAGGNVYVSDGLLAAVQVFDAGGKYLGFIGRSDPWNPHSGSVFMAPAGLSVAGDALYVVDRFAGLFVFHLD